MTGSGGAQREQPHFIGDILRMRRLANALFLLCKEGTEEIPKLDKNTFLHKFDGVPFALRAYLCYNK